MYRRLPSRALVLASLFAAGPSLAQTPACVAGDNPLPPEAPVCLTPVQPRPGEAFQLTFSELRCSYARSWVVRSDNAIDIYIAHFMLCFSPPRPLRPITTIQPGLPAGTYTINLHTRAWPNEPPPFDPDDYALAESSEFVVAGIPVEPTGVPGPGTIALVLMTIALLAAACVFHRRPQARDRRP